MNLKQLKSTSSNRNTRISDSRDGGIRFDHCNLYFYGTKMDINGNSCFILSFPNLRKFTIQTGYEYDFGANQNANQFVDRFVGEYDVFKNMDDMESFFITLIQKFGSNNQRKQLLVYRSYTPSTETFNKIYGIHDSRRIKDGGESFAITLSSDGGTAKTYYTKVVEDWYSSNLEECKMKAFDEAVEYYNEIVAQGETLDCVWAEIFYNGSAYEQDDRCLCTIQVYLNEYTNEFEMDDDF